MVNSGEESARAGASCPGKPTNAKMRERFDTIVMPHLDAVFRMARTLTRDQAEAEDLAQETFVRALGAFERFELRDYGPRPWLLRILHNVFYRVRGRRRLEPTLLDDVDFDHFADELTEAGSYPESSDRINWEKFDEELKAAVDCLQPEYRVVVLLWAIEGLTYKEIAQVCDCPLGTVMSRLYRARRKLGDELRGYARDRKISTKRFD